MAHVVACQTVLIREDWMRKHMEGHESEKVWSYSRISQLAEGTSIFVWNWFFMVDHDIGKTHHVKTYETFESHYVLGVPIISPSTFPGSSALNKAHCNHVQCFHDFLLLTDTKKQLYWDPVYMSQNFEFAGAAPPGVRETWIGVEGKGGDVIHLRVL